MEKRMKKVLCLVLLFLTVFSICGNASASTTIVVHGDMPGTLTATATVVRNLGKYPGTSNIYRILLLVDCPPWFYGEVEATCTTDSYSAPPVGFTNKCTLLLSDYPTAAGKRECFLRMENNKKGYANVSTDTLYFQKGYQFKDVKSSKSFFFMPVYWAVDMGITNGYTDKNGKLTGYFGPNDSCTRAQIVTFLYRADGCPEVDYSNAPRFRDVKKGAYYYDAIVWAYQFDITTGYTDSHGNPTGYFGTDDICTRAQVVTLLYRAIGEPKPASSPLPSFTDVRKNDYYYNAVIWAAQNGITTGISKTKFAPNDPCIRGQVVTFLYRLWRLEG